ncbi:FAD-binding oxidoreductase [Mesorhizobium sp. WSM1497]|uniref:FAD-binding oxidoreductase n=1 Tax=Mesorhizobium sp. WSM1497 TaxID=278153 RepID=UPI0007ED24D3|nr:FAD-binding oxidoreductase [Mesorhizobium sp. WSM1497]
MQDIPGCSALRPTDNEAYEKGLPVYNRRTEARPALRALCSTPEAVAGVVDWARRNGVPFATRSGGHSYEGYCCSPDVVIDVQGLDSIDFDPREKTVSVGAGVTLGAIYKALRDRGDNIGFVAGTCPTVGVAGHVLGGGYGFLARAYGLACDNLLSVGLVDANGLRIQASATANADLFWACRGGGGGSFGIATDFTFQTRRVDGVYVFKLVWSLPKARAKRLIKAWQAWAPATHSAITPLLKVGKTDTGVYGMRCIGQSIGTEAQLRRELAVLTAVEPTGVVIQHKTFFAAVDGFSGGWAYMSKYSKERSDYVASLSDAGIDMLLDRLMGIPTGHVVALLNAYGGAINDVAAGDTAFAHRKGTGFCIHYYSEWELKRYTSSRLRESASVFAPMRPHVSGGAYVNYCDADLADYQHAYWGANLARLKQIKRKYDPGNLFRHGQSVRPA